jgi:hypothetical protein
MAKIVLLDQCAREDQKKPSETRAERQELLLGEIVRRASDECFNLKVEQR